MSSFTIGVLIGAALMGIAMGLFPLIIGLIFERNRIAFIGFVACVIAGLILGVLAAMPVSLGFTIYIAVKVRDERKKKVEDMYSL